MSENEWNDDSRNDLRGSLIWAIQGELRFARFNHQGILEHVRDVYMQDICPEEEWQSFLNFAGEEIEKAAAKLTAEMATWPKDTDCDRLDRVESTLRDHGILLWQASPCCDTCTSAELPDRADVIDNRHPGFRDRLRGYAFFIDQNITDELAEGSNLNVYLAYGFVPSDNREMSPDENKAKTLGIAEEVCHCLQSEGFKVDWNGDLSRKIGLSLNWQRRHLLQ